MKERESNMRWFPFWTDKWIFGSMRIECNVVERAIWIDLLALASKDKGFIRANEETPYLITQLAGMLVIKEDQLNDAIKKFIKIGKLQKDNNGILCISKWDKYQLSDRHRRRINQEMSGNSDIPAGKKDPIGEDSIKEDSNNDKEIIKDNDIETEFKAFWIGYGIMGNSKDDIGDKKEAEKAYKVLRKKISEKELIKAFHGEADYLKYEKVTNNFNKRKKYASTWLRSDRWKTHIDFKYKPRL